MPLDTDALPRVTVQLPIYNERYVVERLMDNIILLDYPRHLLQILVLDDSTDDTLVISRKKVADYREKGYDITLLHRQDRKGYKAGALKEAMPYTKGAFIAIFDADFMPRPDFLYRLLPAFSDERLGVVQSRWEHLNRDYSLITMVQALPLNVHFTVEQSGRYAAGSFLQFNGTAGIWRRTAIEDAGGWQEDTLTEDLDLSYRAQLKGWHIAFNEAYSAPAELPADMNGLKSQQFRWMKGGAECAVKLLPRIWHAKLPLLTKINGIGHLMNSTLFLAALIMGIVSVPVAYWLPRYGIQPEWLKLFQLSMLPLLGIFYVANVLSRVDSDIPFGKRILRFIALFPLLLMFSQGLSLHNADAVVQGWRRRKSPFVRTPKYNLLQATDRFQTKSYLAVRLPWTTIGELILAMYFLLSAIAGTLLANWAFMVYHTMLAIGFGAVGMYSVAHRGR